MGTPAGSLMGAGGLDGNWEFLKPVEIVVEVPDLFRKGIYTWAIKRVRFTPPTSQRGDHRFH